jgi:hypothetical protein
MANIVANIAKGRVVEFYNRVKANDPANSALILVPIETTGLETDAVLIDKDDLAAWLSGATNEQTTMGRKTLTDADLAALPAPDDTNDRYDISLPTVTWDRGYRQRDQQDPRLLRQRHHCRHRREHPPAVPVRLRHDAERGRHPDDGRRFLPGELKSAVAAHPRRRPHLELSRAGLAVRRSGSLDPARTSTPAAPPSAASTYPSSGRSK